MDQDQAVIKIVKAAHPQDLGEATYNLEKLIYEETDKLIRSAMYEQKMEDVRIVRSSGWHWAEKLVQRIILWQK